ncbi:COQ9 family protein [Sulfitobacter sabulilitoris]|uniref:COQ9 family protein n=1 Tax=Sulfitobacter sabulilitoris TaxID=2562655 RepID=A0A5S3PFN0_9RHOB|nr:COQ9 family protein [Sulfitobacter sabulilitoris]TMM52880.1 COQ9 family protein [Sulfitobacter sabulilitoris]
MTVAYEKAKNDLLDAALKHVAFEGWSPATFEDAVRDTGIDAGVARAVCPRGALDLAVAYHKRGDAQMVQRIRDASFDGMKFRDKIAAAVRIRLDLIADKELARRGSTLFALPHHAAEGSALIWGTADAIWTALGDTSDDVNWYTKRATLSAVYSATLLYWLGDSSTDNEATWAFLDRRIDNVMQIEKLKAHVRDSPTLSRLMAGPNWLLGHIKAPSKASRSGLPGRWADPRESRDH